MPIGEIVISSPVIPLPVKAVHGIQAVRDVMQSLKVVFRRVLQNATRFGAVWLAEPLINRLQRVVSQNATVSHIATHFTMADYIASIFDKVWLY